MRFQFLLRGPALSTGSTTLSLSLSHQLHLAAGPSNAPGTGVKPASTKSFNTSAWQWGVCAWDGGVHGMVFGSGLGVVWVSITTPLSA